MVKRMKYKDLNQTLKYLRRQVIDSLDYCVHDMPTFTHPEEMFNTLRNMVIYQNDPPGVELLQSVPTLMDNNYWGKRGAGDCDCFTILTLAMCVANGWNDNEIILTGHSASRASHIYSATWFNGKRYTLDLTNPYINMERKYKFCQILEI